MKDILMKSLRKIGLIPFNVVGHLSKERKILFRKKKYLILSILLPLLIGIIYIFTLTPNSSNLNIGLCDFDDTDLTKGAVSSLNDFNIVKLEKEDCISNLVNSVKNREVLFGIFIHDGFTDEVMSYKETDFNLYYDNSDPAISSLASWKIDIAMSGFKNQKVISFVDDLKSKSDDAKSKTEFVISVLDSLNNNVVNRLKEPINAVDDEFRTISAIDSRYVAEPIVSRPIGVHNDFKMIELGLAPIFAILSMFIILMLSSTGVIYDRKIGLISRIRASNSNLFSYLMSKLFFFFILTIVQFVIVLGIFTLFGASFNFDFISLIKALLFIAIVDTLIGIIIGVISDSEGVAVLISLMITLPLMFLSGLFYPVELMPKFVSVISNIMPLNQEIFLLKSALLFSSPVESSIFWPVVILFVVVWFYINRKG